MKMETSGVAISVRRLVEELSKQTIDVYLMSVGKPAKISHNGYIDEHFMHDFATIPVLRSMFFSNNMRQGIKSELLNASIIHCHGLWQMTNIYGGWYAGVGRIKPLVISPHGMLSPGALQFSKVKKWAFWNAFQHHVAHAASCFHATCEEEYKEIRAYGIKAPVAIIPNGVDLPEWREKSTFRERRRVISLGRIHPKKALDRLVAAWAQLESDFPDWDLVIVGPNQDNYAEKLQKQAKKLGLCNFSIFGPVFGTEKTNLLHSSDIFVLPTLSENFALTVAESLAVGTPVISTKGAPWERLKENECGWWIEHGIEPLVDAMQEAMSMSPERRIEMGKNGRNWMLKDFSWKTIAQKMATVYQWLDEGGEPPSYVRVK